MQWTVSGYDDPQWRIRLPSWATWCVLVISVLLWWLFTPFGWKVASVIGGLIYWAIESFYNSITRVDPGGRMHYAGLTGYNPRRGRLSTGIQLFWSILTFQFAVLLTTGLAFGNVWLFLLVTFPIGFWAYEVFIVHLCLVLWGQRPWAKYHGKAARFNGAIKLNMYHIWLGLGLLVWYLWPKLVVVGEHLL